MQQGFHFRGKRQLSAEMRVVERLHSKMIACQKQLRPARAQIANSEREHALEAMNTIRALFFVKVDHNFRVGIRGKGVAFALQLTAKFSEVIDFAVIGDPDRAVFVAHRHVAVGRQVKDGEAAAPETNVGTVGESTIPQTGIVRATVCLNVCHPSEHFPISPICQTVDAAHPCSLLRFLFQFINLCFDVKKLDALKTAINQSWHSVEKSHAEDVFIEKESQWRPRECEEVAPQPAAALRLYAYQRGFQFASPGLTPEPNLC